VQRYRVVELVTRDGSAYRLQRGRDLLATFHFQEAAVHTAISMARVSQAMGDDVLVTLERSDGTLKVIEAALGKRFVARTA
jgi:hypothetical protein